MQTESSPEEDSGKTANSGTESGGETSPDRGNVTVVSEQSLQSIRSSLHMLISITILMLIPALVTLLLLLATDINSGLVGLFGLIGTLIAGLIAVVWIAVPVYRGVLSISAIAETLSKGGSPTKSAISKMATSELQSISETLVELGQNLEIDRIQRQIAQRKLEQRASRDALTGLYNRHHVGTMAEQRLSIVKTSVKAGDKTSSIGVLFLDLNNFKTINDLWGHGIGDQVLIEVGRRMKLLMGDQGTIARWGGDEFLVVVEDAKQVQLEAIAERIYSLFLEPVATSSGRHRIACSVGTALSKPGESFDDLLLRADSKMFGQKQANRGAKLIDATTVRLVEEALADYRVDVYFQPIVGIKSATSVRICGAEALVRIRSLDGRLFRPDEFLPDILNSHYASDIDERVAKIALDYLSQWKQLDLVNKDFVLSLNLSPASAHDDKMAPTLEHIVRARGLSTRMVALEISPQADEIDNKVIADIDSRGFQIGVDALGVKRSNFDRISDPVTDLAKIDRRWIREPEILASMIKACDEKNVKVIVQGIETAKQLELAISLGAQHCQGYLISEPIEASAFERMLKGQR